MEGKGLLQKNIWKHPTNLDAQEPRSPCFCPKIGQIDKGPEMRCCVDKIMKLKAIVFIMLVAILVLIWIIPLQHNGL